MLVERLHLHSGISIAYLNLLAATASERYKVFAIPKRSGGLRTIEQPSREIKSVQRWLNRVLFGKFPVHCSAKAYTPGSSIWKNAEEHRKSNFTVRIDFSSFFPSFKGRHVQYFIRQSSDEKGIGLTDEDVAFVRGICCRNDSLTIGAPSSPILTNAMMYGFDASLYRWASDNELIYTRYADDIFVSSTRPNQLSDALGVITALAREYQFGSLQVNDRKTAFLSRRYRRTITGLVVTTDRKLSIGRNRKTEIKSSVYAYQHGRIQPEKLQWLRGMLAFVSDVEPTFYESLCRKYGRPTIERIQDRPAKSVAGQASPVL